MTLKKIIKREFEVAFSKNAQPLWLRISKYALIGGFIFFFWKSQLFWIILFIIFFLALMPHLWYRYRTKGWTQSYCGWDYEKNKPKSQ